MELTEGTNNESVTTSRRRLYTLQSVSQSEAENQSNGIGEFKDQIQKKFARSVANKIYSFPLVLTEDSLFLSDSDTEGLEDIKEYDLNSQNKKQRTVQWEQPVSKEKVFKKKNCLEQKGIDQKRLIRQKSLEAKRKYADLLKLIDKKQTTHGTMTTSIQLVNKSRQSLKKQSSSNHFKSKEELPQPIPQPIMNVQNEFKTKPLTSKINRLRTEPDESLVTTHRVNGIIKFRNNAAVNR